MFDWLTWSKRRHGSEQRSYREFKISDMTALHCWLFYFESVQYIILHQEIRVRTRAKPGRPWLKQLLNPVLIRLNFHHHSTFYYRHCQQNNFIKTQKWIKIPVRWPSMEKLPNTQEDERKRLESRHWNSFIVLFWRRWAAILKRSIISVIILWWIGSVIARWLTCISELDLI